MNAIIALTNIKIGRRVYFEDENYQGNGKISHIPTDEEQDFFKKVNGEAALFVKPNGASRARAISISQIVLL